MKKPANKPRPEYRCAAFQPLFRFLTAVLVFAAAQPSLAREYTLAVVPQLAPAMAHGNWTPFVERLGAETANPIRLRVYRTFDEFETELARGVPDFVYLNPFHQIMARRTQGYLPLVRDGSRQLTGALVVRSDSPARTVQDLNGQQIGFPDPNAFAASLYMRALLQEKENIRFTPRYLVSHGNVYRHVIFGDTAAGAGVNLTLEHERPELRAALRVLYVTPGTAPHPLSAHPRVPAKIRHAVQAAIIKMQEDEAGRGLLQNIQMQQPIPADHARDYAPLEKLQLDQHLITTRLRAR